MEIERINENTVKFYISYVDIEERGFDREEIWYNRERSEELFWEMMDEINDEEDFPLEGPLWIQVHANDKGLEVIVTKAQLSKDGQKLELPVVDEKFREIPVDENIESLLDKHFNMSERSASDEKDETAQLQFVIKFQDFEDVISLASHRLDGFLNSLYVFEQKYYLFVEFSDKDDEQIENLLSIMLEYGQESRMTIHRLEEYGKLIMKDNALEQIETHFS
ncbi:MULTISPECIES: adaptor protein MecA [Aeribacillus]|uniref:adaptor protein MecA n=1 Tax=Aeribacillus TaxID=1055323 RepID=UPI00119C89EB|nr:adaptor protein MecA [Aeribacillus composti]MED1438533.1 adaptor protein MecA [Aeribacillus composti]TVZ89168.1 adapter protein MecA 1/2 [Aeribacillus composti]